MTDSHINDDRIYYNISIKGEKGTSIASYQEDRTKAILENPSDYYLTISRFSIPAIDIPIFIADIEPNQPDRDLTRYIFSIKYNGFTYSIPVTWETQSLLAPIPPPPIPKQVVNSTYYFCFTYTRAIQLINNALLNAWQIAKVADTNVGNYAPYFFYDVNTQKISLVTEYAYSQPGGPEVRANRYAFEKFFIGFNVSLDSQTNAEYSFKIENNQGTNYYYPAGFTVPAPTTPTVPPTALVNPTPSHFLIQSQNWRSLSTWASLIDIVFLTGTIPITYEYTQSAGSQGDAQFTPILTDFEPYLNDAGDGRSVFSYFPQGPYRLINLNSNTPLKRFDFQIYWKDKLGRLFPLTIPEDQVANVKFLFIKKSTYVEEL